MKLSKRLDAICKNVIKYKHGEVLADIGTDHAYLPCYLVLNNIIDKAYACDVAVGPLNSSKETIAQYHLKERITPLLGSGTDPILNKNVDMITMCGMGGQLMIELLDAHLEMLKNHRFILQANIGNEYLREYLYNHHMVIIDEDIVKDASHIYEIIVCEYGNSPVLNEVDFLFGPFLRQRKDPLFIEMWKRQLVVQQRIIDSLDENHQKYKETIDFMNLIKQQIEE